MSTTQPFKKSKQELIDCFQSLKVLQDSLFESIQLLNNEQLEKRLASNSFDTFVFDQASDIFNDNEEKLATITQHNQEVMDNLKDLLDNL